jgi:hypothetical protein
VKHLVTIGVGNLIDPVDLAKDLPFQFKVTGKPATKQQIADEWHRIKASTHLANKLYPAFASITSLELNNDAVNDLIYRRLTQNAEFIIKQEPFTAFEIWPADAQLGLLSMLWALGPGGLLEFHHLRADCTKLDFAAAARDCYISEVGNPGLAPRNKADVVLFSNAARVMKNGINRTKLYYPAVL